MRRLVLFTLAILIFHQSQAQESKKSKSKQEGPRYHTGIYHPRPPKKDPVYQAAYIGFSTGINNPVGLLGVNIDLAFTQHVSTCFGIGLSTWGYKPALEARYYFDSCNRGWAVMAGVSYNTGANNVTVDNIETTNGDQTIVVNLKPQASFSISFGRFIGLGRSGKNRLYIQTGYSIPFSSPTFDRTDSPIPLTDKGRRTVLTVAPGGLVLALGFSFGTGARR